MDIVTATQQQVKIPPDEEDPKAIEALHKAEQER